MRLTNYMRQAFVRSVMNDVPEIDYQEQMIKVVKKHHLAILKNLKIPTDTDINRFNQAYTYMCGVSVACPGLLTEEINVIQNLPECLKFEEVYDAQRIKRQELRRNITGAIGACNTRKQAVEAFPELEKYLPQDEAVVLRSLPVITNVFVDLVKAGWPKDQKRSNKLAKAKQEEATA